jgi:threonine/homoserine/homoserine lactone efflux protein
MATDSGMWVFNGHPMALLLGGIALGLGAAMPIGPVNVEMARRALRGGFFAGAALGCGAVSVDVCYALLYWVGVAQFTQINWVYWTLALAGVGLLVYLGVGSLRSAFKGAEPEIAETQSLPSVRGGYLTGLLMTATNPMTVAYWFSVLPAAVGNTGRGLSDLPIICLGVLLGTLAWVVFLSTLLGVAGRYRQPWWLRAADATGGVFMLAIAVIALWRLQHRSL